MPGKLLEEHCSEQEVEHLKYIAAAVTELQQSCSPVVQETGRKVDCGDKVLSSVENDPIEEAEGITKQAIPEQASEGASKAKILVPSSMAKPKNVREVIAPCSSSCVRRDEFCETIAELWAALEHIKGGSVPKPPE